VPQLLPKSVKFGSIHGVLFPLIRVDVVDIRAHGPVSLLKTVEVPLHLLY
jgi:hypothetical protein